MMLHDASGREQQMLCLPVRKVFSWLGTISARRVKPEMKDRLLAYQRHCDEVLWDHFMGRARAEVEAERMAARRLAEDLIARKPLWVKVRAWVEAGWSFEAIWRASGRSARVVDEAVADLLRLGLIAAAPAGTPHRAQPTLFDARGAA